MLSKSGQPIVSRAEYDDFERFEAAVAGWTPTVRKLDRRPFSARLTQMALDPVQIVSTSLGAHVEMCGTAAADHRSFGLPMPASSPAVWCRNPVSRLTVSVYDASGVFEAHTRPGFETVVFSIRPEALSGIAESLGHDAECAVGKEVRVERCDAHAMLEIRKLLCQALRFRGSGECPEVLPGLRDLLTDEIPARLLQALERTPSRRPVPIHLRARALRRALDYAHSHADRDLRVTDLCCSARTSERTLRRAFRESLGISPKAYLQARRLDGVYRELSSARARTVADAAYRWGFWHLSQLSQDYKRQFGELPSETLASGRRGARPRPGPTTR